MKIEKILDILEDHKNTTMLGKMTKTRDAYKILIATMLSARSRDEQAEKVANNLFKYYDSPLDMSKAPLKKIEKIISHIGLYKEKARRIKEASKQIVERYDGQTPSSMHELISLSGVGRKTAGCVLVYAFGIPAIPVDIHVHRISNRIGLVKTKTPGQTEQELEKITPKRYWLRVNELFVKHGKTICRPINPKCNECPINKYCEYYKTNFGNN